MSLSAQQAEQRLAAMLSGDIAPPEPPSAAGENMGKLIGIRWGRSSTIGRFNVFLVYLKGDNFHLVTHRSYPEPEDAEQAALEAATTYPGVGVEYRDMVSMKQLRRSASTIDGKAPFVSPLRG